MKDKGEEKAPDSALFSPRKVKTGMSYLVMIKRTGLLFLKTTFSRVSR